MPTLKLTTDQVAQLVKQLPEADKSRIYADLREERWKAWTAQADYMQEGLRTAAAERGRHWDQMSEEEQEDFIQDLCEEP